MRSSGAAIWRRRAARQRWLRLAVGAVVLVAVTGLSISVGDAARQPDIAVRAGLRAASADNNSMVWERTAASNPGPQDVATRALLRAAFATPVSISSSAVGDAISIGSAGAAALPLRDDAALRAATSGLPALGPGEIAIDDTGAANLHVRQGGTIAIETSTGFQPVTVAAIWHARDPKAPIWNGIGLGTSGAVARIAISPGELAKDQIGLVARWSISPDLAHVTASDLPALESGYDRLAARVTKAASFEQLIGGGANTLAVLGSGLAAVSAVVPVAIALLSAGTVLALLLLTRLLAELRIDESALLRARGASRVQIAAADIRASLTPVLAAAVIGGVLSQSFLWFSVARPTSWAEVAIPILAPTVVALIAVVAASSTTKLEVAHARALRVIGVVVTALLCVIAVVSVIRLLTADAGSDPAGDLAPAFVIAALVIVGMLIGPAVVASADAITGRRDGVRARLATRRLRWRPGLVAGALVLVALAVGSSGFAASTISSSNFFLADAGKLVTGGDLDVQVAGDESITPGPPQTNLARVARLADASAAAPALVEQDQLGDLNATLTAAPVSALGGLQNAGLADAPALRRTVGAAIGIPLEKSGPLIVALDVRAASAPADTRVRLTAWVSRPGSGLVRIALPAVPVGTATVRAGLPAGGAGRLVALDAVVTSTGAFGDLAVSVRSISQGAATSHPLPKTAWVLTKAIAPEAGAAASGVLGWTAFGSSEAGGGSFALGRLMPSGSSTVPVALSGTLSATSGIGLGNSAVLINDPNIPFTVVAIVPQTIGATGDTGVWADLPTLQTALLRLGPDVPRADHAWLAVDDPQSASVRVAASEPTALITASPIVAFAPLAQPLVLGTLAAAAGTLLFALLAIATVVTSLLRARHPEIAVLRALGTSAGTQRIASRIELAAVIAYAVVIGAVAALVAVILTVPSIAHAVAPGIAPDVAAPVVVDPVILGAALVILVAGAIVGLVAQERVIARIANRPGTEVPR